MPSPRSDVSPETWPDLEHGQGVPCAEAQADGVPCDEMKSDCTDCERVLRAPGNVGGARKRD